MEKLKREDLEGRIANLEQIAANQQKQIDIMIGWEMKRKLEDDNEF